MGLSAFELLRRSKEKQTADMAGVLRPAPAASAAEALERLKASSDAQRAGANPVITEAERILALPTWDRESLNIDLTGEFKLPHGTMTLNANQSLALYFARQVKGLVAPLAVGTGKALLTFLLPIAMGARRPLLLIPSDMVNPTNREIAKMRQHWRLPLEKTPTTEPLRLLPYSQLSVAKSTDVLDKLQPDLIIADEAQNLRYPTSARTKRVIRYFQRFPNTMFAGLSGTFTSRGLKDYAHLVELALRQGSPIPLTEDDLIAWAGMLDAGISPRPQDIRTFEGFCPDIREQTAGEISRLAEDLDDDLDDEQTKRLPSGVRAMKRIARRAFRERFTSTPGVVATREASVKCSLILRERRLEVPHEIGEALDALKKTWCRPDGEELASGLDYWRCASQIAQGFYYRWVWPNGIVDHEWMDRRATWHREVRWILQRNITGLDSPLLVMRAVMDMRLDQFGLEPAHVRGLIRAWNEWSEVKHRPKPPTETVWLSSFLLEDALDWRAAHPRGLIWFDDNAVEEMFRAVGVETYGGGEDPPEDGRGMALSINAFKAGRNLQKNSENLWLSFPSSGLVCEQTLGRTHRQGQEADEVTCDYYAHTDGARRAIQEAIKGAEYIQDSQGSPQKLLYATWL